MKLPYKTGNGVELTNTTYTPSITASDKNYIPSSGASDADVGVPPSYSAPVTPRVTADTSAAMSDNGAEKDKGKKKKNFFDSLSFKSRRARQVIR